MWRWLLLVDPRVFWVPGPAVGPGCAVRAASFDRRFCLLSGQAPPPTSAAAHVPRSSAFRFLRHPSDLAHQSRMQFPRDYFKL